MKECNIWYHEICVGAKGKTFHSWCPWLELYQQGVVIVRNGVHFGSILNIFLCF